MLKWIERMLRWRDRESKEAKLEPRPTEADNPPRGLETGNRALAQPLPRGAGTHPPRPNPAQRGGEHGLRGRASGPGRDGGGTLAPRDATRYIETRLGILSYTRLAPHLARNVLALEKRIEDGEFAQAALDDALPLRFHSLICGDLVPQLAGWRRANVTVGGHEPPQFFKVPALPRDYGLDLQAPSRARARRQASNGEDRVDRSTGRGLCKIHELLRSLARNPWNGSGCWTSLR